LGSGSSAFWWTDPVLALRPLKSRYEMLQLAVVQRIFLGFLGNSLPLIAARDRISLEQRQLHQTSAAPFPDLCLRAASIKELGRTAGGLDSGPITRTTRPKWTAEATMDFLCQRKVESS